MKFTVTVHALNKDGDPVDIHWGKNYSALGASAAASMAIVEAEERQDNWYTFMGISITRNSED